MASGNSLFSFFATEHHPQASVDAKPDTRNTHPVLRFDASTAWSACFHGVLVRHYDGGGITLTLAWMGASATSGNVMWTAAFERLDAGGQDLDSDGFASAQAAAAAAANAASGKLTYTTITFTDGAQIDGVTVGEVFRLKVTRDATNGSDTMTGDAQLMSVEGIET